MAHTPALHQNFLVPVLGSYLLSGPSSQMCPLADTARV